MFTKLGLEAMQVILKLIFNLKIQIILLELLKQMVLQHNLTLHLITDLKKMYLITLTQQQD